MCSRQDMNANLCVACSSFSDGSGRSCPYAARGPSLWDLPLECKPSPNLDDNQTLIQPGTQTIGTIGEQNEQVILRTAVVEILSQGACFDCGV
jgi:hypothetical protein